MPTPIPASKLPPIKATCGIITHNKGKMMFLNAVQNTFAQSVDPLIFTGSEPRDEIMKAVNKKIEGGPVDGAPAGAKAEPRLDIVLLEGNLGATDSPNLSFDRNFFDAHSNTRFVLFSEADMYASIAAANLPENVIFSVCGISPAQVIREIRDAYLAQVTNDGLDLPTEPVNTDPLSGKANGGQQAGPEVEGGSKDGKDAAVEPTEKPVVKTDIKYGTQFGPKLGPNPSPEPKGPR